MSRDNSLPPRKALIERYVLQFETKAAFHQAFSKTTVDLAYGLGNPVIIKGLLPTTSDMKDGTPVFCRSPDIDDVSIYPCKLNFVPFVAPLLRNSVTAFRFPLADLDMEPLKVCQACRSEICDGRFSMRKVHIVPILPYGIQ